MPHGIRIPVAWEDGFALLGGGWWNYRDISEID
jgi:hypothetical protein